MARPKEFDVDDALQRALEVFWQRGYDATSLQHLVAAMGIQKASLYATFGDKHSLYLAALRRYQHETLEELTAHLAGAASPYRAVVEFLDEVLRHTARDGRRGCLCVNANIELAPHDESVADLLRQHHERMESLLAATLDRARTLGEIPRKADPRALATFLLGIVVAINVLGKQRATRRQLQALRDQAVAALAR
ncbi:MAG: TetR/AcrR family transcriptional regulator [Planctomycetes bacterium]|nr:TetR/AcrR family transcriptional regulator [Planctomycetota bacterium]